MTYEDITAMVVNAGHDPMNTRGFTALVGKNEDSENVIVEGHVEDGELIWYIITHQNNGWTRTNVYYADGTVDELYDR